MPSAIEKVLDLLVKEGLLTREQVDELLRAREGTSSLTDLIVSKGFADPARLSMTLLTMKALPLVCPKCRVRHVVRNLKLDGAYVCKRCGGALEAEDVVPSGSGPIAKIEDPTPPDVLEARKDPKRVLGKYTLLRELGRGGMAVVYQAWDSSLAQHVALKLIKSSDLGLPDDAAGDDVAEFLREARMAARLQHPNIVRVFEVGSNEGRHFLSMEYVEGVSLAQLARPEGRGSRVPPFHAHPKRFLVLLRDTALALDHAHRNAPPIVHRDVKPQNILVDGKGRACLVDFGLAREMRGGGRLTVSGVTKGTPCYMSPEQALGRHDQIDGRTDVWGLGATLYEVLAGRPPFEGPTERDILNKVIHEEPRRPSEALRAAGVVAPAHSELEAIALKCLEKEPARRYASAGEVARELDRVLAGEQVEARAVTPLGRALRWAARRKPLVAAVGAAVLMGVVALVAILRGGGGTRIVERVVVERDPASKLNAAALELERKAVDFRFEEAAQGYAELIAATQDPAEQGLLRQRQEDLRLQRSVLEGLVQRIQKAPRDYAPFRLKGSVLDPARVLDATSERIILRHGGKLAEHPWGRVDPRQYVRLVKDYWPDIDGRAALGFGVWCLRQGIIDEAAFAFQKQSAPEAKRYLEELSARAKELDPAVEAQRTKLLREAEDALAKGDTVIARARFERVLTIQPGDAGAAKGLERTAAAEKKPDPKPAEPAKPEPPAAPAGPPPSTGPSLIPADAALAADYAKGRPLFRAAMKSGDVRRAIELAGAPVPGGLAELEAWLASPAVRSDLELRRAFDRRDALVLERAVAAMDAAVDFLAKVKAQVTVTVNGQARKGTLERSRGKLFLNETVASGGGQGTVSWPITPTFGNRLDWLARARTLRHDKLEWRDLLGDVLLAAYESGDVSGVGPVAAAAGAEQAKARMDDWARLWLSSATWSVSLLRAEARERWTKQGTSVDFDPEGRLLLKPAAELLTAFEGGRLEPGVRLEVRLRVESVEVKDGADVQVGFLAPQPGGQWKWRETARLDFASNRIHFTSHPDGSMGERAGGATFYSSPTSWISLRFDLGASTIAMYHDGAKLGVVPFIAPEDRRLAIVVAQAKVRVDTVRLSGLTDDPVEASTVRSSPPSGEYQWAIRRGLAKQDLREFWGAIEEFGGALAERPGDAYASGLRGSAYLAVKAYDAAVADFDRGLAGDAGNLRKWLLELRGRAKRLKGDLAGALKDYDEGLALDSKSVALLRERASLHYHLRDYGSSVVDTARAMELDPNSGNDFHHRGLCHFDTGQWKRAAEDFRRATELGSWSTDYAWLGLWMARARMGEQAAASQELRGYASRQQGLDKAWFRTVALFLAGGSTEGDFLAAAAAPQDPRTRTDQLCEAYYYAALQRLVAGDSAGAEPLLRKCVETGVTNFIEYVGALSELDALAGKRPTTRALPSGPFPPPPPLVVPQAEYSFAWKDFEAMGVYENRVAPDGRSCWQAARAMYGAEVLQNYVELKFEAEAGKTYRCWVQVGGCCQETLDPIAQVSELEYADPKQGGKKFAVEPGGSTAFPPKLYAGSLPKTHAQHGGTRAPTAWRWVQVELPAKYAAPGTKRVRILSPQEGFAVRAAVVSTTRTAAPSPNE